MTTNGLDFHRGR